MVCWEEPADSGLASTTIINSVTQLSLRNHIAPPFPIGKMEMMTLTPQGVCGSYERQLTPASHGGHIAGPLPSFPLFSNGTGFTLFATCAV